MNKIMFYGFLTDRTTDVLSRLTRQAKTDGLARITLGREDSDSDRSFSLLGCLVRTSGTDGRTDGLTGQVRSVHEL